MLSAIGERVFRTLFPGTVKGLVLLGRAVGSGLIRGPGGPGKKGFGDVSLNPFFRLWITPFGFPFRVSPA